MPVGQANTLPAIAKLAAMIEKLELSCFTPFSKQQGPMPKAVLKSVLTNSYAVANSREINARLALQRERGNAVDLFAIRNAAVIFAPARLLGIAKKIGASDMMVMANLGAAKPGEIAFRPIRASAVKE